MAKGNPVKRFRINNFSGGMNTEAEDNALLSIDPNANAGIAFTQIKTECRRIENFIPLSRGSLTKAPGFSTHYNTGVASSITGLYRFRRSNGNSYFIYSQGSKVYNYTGGVGVDIGATVASTYTHFETAQDYLIICDGTNSPQKWDGTTLSSVGGSPPAAARQSLFYQNRLWMFSASSNTSLLYYSDAGNIEAGYGSNFVNCDVNDGQKITSISKFFIPGSLEPVILVGKERCVGIITGDGTASNPFTYARIQPDLGIPGFRQIIQFGQNASFLTPQGVSSYETALKDINIVQNLISEPIRDQFALMNSSYKQDALGWFDWRKNLVSYAVPQDTSTYPNVIWNYDVSTGAWSKQTGFNVTAALVDTDGTFYHGDDTGKIYIHNSTDYDYGSAAINGVIELPYLDFMQPNQYKRIVWASITFRTNGNYSLGISSRMDYGTKTGSSHTITVPNSIYTWNGGTWTSNAGTYQWGGSTLVTKKFYPKGIFQNIAFQLTQSGSSQPIDIFDLSFEVEYLNLT